MRSSRFIIVFAAGVAFSAAAALAAFAQAASTGGCADPLAVIRAFYAANDARQSDKSAGYLAPDVVFDTWATGVNGYIMAKRHRVGRAALKDYLPEARGVRHRLPDSPPDGPIFHETRLSVSGNTVQFMLEPDRLRPNGRPYNPYSVEVVLEGCRIKTLTVIERVTWL
jgi:hypothetical protein